MSGVHRDAPVQDVRAAVREEALRHAAVPDAAADRGAAAEAAEAGVGRDVPVGHHLLLGHRRLHRDGVREHSNAGGRRSAAHQCQQNPVGYYCLLTNQTFLVP